MLARRHHPVGGRDVLMELPRCWLTHSYQWGDGDETQCGTSCWSQGNPDHALPSPSSIVISRAASAVVVVTAGILGY